MKKRFVKKYDVEMLKDFLEQLKWALRVDHFELTAGPNALHPELLDQVRRTSKKRGALRLLAFYTLKKDNPALTEEDMQEAMRQFGLEWAKKRAEQLRHLEALDELFKEARAHATGELFGIVVPASKVLDGSWFKDSDGK